MQNRRKILIICAIFVTVIAVGGYGYYFLKSESKPVRPVGLKIKESTPKEQSQPVKKEGAKSIPVTSITEFNPTTVFSGTLGEVTALQAGRDINKAAFEMKEYQVKLKELEDRLVSIPESFMLPASTAPSSPLISSPAISETPSLAIPQSQEKERLVVLAVKGLGNNGLTATLRSRSGTYTVKVGETVPGFGKVSSITRDRVTVNNAALPWL